MWFVGKNAFSFLRLVGFSLASFHTQAFAESSIKNRFDFSSSSFPFKYFYGQREIPPGLQTKPPTTITCTQPEYGDEDRASDWMNEKDREKGRNREPQKSRQW